MKRRLFTFLLLVVSLVSFTLAFTACGGKEPDHECKWETTWSKDATYHWYACEDDTCTKTKDKAEHSFVEGVCVCGYEDPNYVPSHVCDFETTWSKDDTYHWYACKDATCDLRKDQAEHTLVNGECSVCGFVDPSQVPAQVIGFNTKDSVVVLTGTKIVLERPEPVDQNGTKLDVYFDVMNKNGGHVATFADGDDEYFYAKGTEYTISYAVYTYDKAVTLKTTKVTTVGSATVGAELNKVYEVGKEIQVVPNSGFYAPEYAITVKNENGDNVAVDGGKFTPSAVGFYDVTVKATSNEFSAEETYEIYVRNEIKDGEIETFYSDWETLREVNGFDPRGWTITDTDKIGLKNYKGEDDTFITYSASSSTSKVSFYLDTLFTHEEYLAMVNEGYTRLTFKVFVKGNELHGLKYHTDLRVGGSLTITLDDLVPNMWNTVSIYFSHVEHSGCLDRNFLTGFVLWDAQEIPFIDISNGKSEDFTIYIDDIFATKDATPTENTDASKDFEVGSTYDLTSIVNEIEGVQYNYLIKNNTAKEEYTLISNPTAYKFTASGDYQIKVIPTEYSYRGENVFSFTVTDDITVKKAWNKVQMTGSSVAINFADIDAVLMNGETAIDTKVLSVWFHDDYALETVTSTGVTIDKAGYYKIYLEGTYGDGYKTYKSVDLDVYTEDTEFMMAKAEDFIATRFWDYQDLPKTEVGEYEVEGENIRAFRVISSIQGATIMFRPMYSKAYYEYMLANYDTKVNFETYYSTATDKKVYTRVMPNKTDLIMQDKWHTNAMNLSWFIENYDILATGYADVNANLLAKGNPTIAYGNYINNGTGANAKYKSYFYMINGNDVAKANIYVKDLSISAINCDPTIYMVDVKDMTETTYDVKSSFGEKGNAELKKYEGKSFSWILTDVNGNTLDSNVVDITKTENHKLWTIELIVGDNIVYRGYVDIFDSSLEPVWGDVSGLSVDVYKSANTISTTRGTLTTFDGKTVVSFKNTQLGSHQWFVVKPSHSKAYYELYQGKGYSLKFEVYIEASTKAFNQLFSYGSQVSTDANMNNKWFTRTITLDKFLAKWDNFAGCPWDGGWGTRNGCGMFYLYNSCATATVYTTGATLSK